MSPRLVATALAVTVLLGLAACAEEPTTSQGTADAGKELPLFPTEDVAPDGPAPDIEGPDATPDAGDADAGAAGCNIDADCSTSGLGPCETVACVAKQCVVSDQPDGTACQNDTCFDGQTCTGGTCSGGAPIDCADADPCTADSCDPIIGCLNTPIPDCCTPSCAGKECGSDGCGGTCGDCGPGGACVAPGVCEGGCTPSCTGKECGGDGCGGSCGSCPAGWSCGGDGLCIFGCTADCAGKECGDDGCGGSCGSCPSGWSCDAAGLCQTGCTPDCAGKECGDDGCGGVCATCPGGYVCNASQQCEQVACEPDCAGKTCGSDGCGGTCGTCVSPEVCQGGTCLDPTAGDTCGDAFDVGALPFTGTGDTTLAGNDYATPGGACPGDDAGFGAASPDHAWRFVPPADGNYEFTLEGDFDTALYVVSDCGDIGGSCLGADDVLIEPEVVVAWLPAGVPAYVIVDGWGDLTTDEGSYTLTVAAWSNPGCTPDCAGKACGPDGCGGQCGACPAGETCSPAAQCVAPGSGDTCGNAWPVTSLPVSLSGDTDAAASDYGFPANSCPGETSGLGGASNDEVYAVTPTESGNYRLLLQPDFDALLWVVQDCAAVGTSCLGASDEGSSGVDEELVLWFDAGETYLVIVDGYSNLGNYSGAYTLTIEPYDNPSCSPACSGKVCGPDGCGGQCGVCGGGDQCTPAGQCQPPGAGETCSDPYVVTTAPITALGSTAAASSDHGFGANACPGESASLGGASKDHVYAFTPPTSGNWHIAIDPTFDALLYVALDCADIDGTCLGAADTGTSSATEELVLWLDAGQTAYVFVDGYSNLSDYSGVYALTIEPYDNPGCTPDCAGKSCGGDGCGGQCGVCAAGLSCLPDGSCGDSDAGQTCADPFVVGALPFSGVGDTSSASNDLSFSANSCPGNSTAKGGASGDHVWRFDPPADGNYRVLLEPGFDAALYVVTDCADVDGTCIGGADQGGNFDDEELVGYASSLLTYYIVVDGYSNSSNLTGAYTLTVEPYTNPGCTPDCAGAECGPDGCGGQCGTCAVTGDVCLGDTCVDPDAGDTCSNAFVVDALPFAASGDTSLGNPDYTGTCSLAWSGSRGAANADHAYAFTPSATGDYTISVDPASSWDAIVYLVTDCAAIGATCLGGQDSGGDGSAETFTVALDAGVPVWVIVDGYGASGGDEGAYTLSIDGP